jgi:hypothetical protein
MGSVSTGVREAGRARGVVPEVPTDAAARVWRWRELQSIVGVCCHEEILIRREGESAVAIVQKDGDGVMAAGGDDEVAIRVSVDIAQGEAGCGRPAGEVQVLLGPVTGESNGSAADLPAKSAGVGVGHVQAVIPIDIRHRASAVPAEAFPHIGGDQTWCGIPAEGSRDCYREERKENGRRIRDSVSRGRHGLYSLSYSLTCEIWFVRFSN